jgi:hypothetical protein
MIRTIGFLLVLLLNTSAGVPIDDKHPNFVIDMSDYDGDLTIKYDFVSPKR